MTWPDLHLIHLGSAKGTWASVGDADIDMTFAGWPAEPAWAGLLGDLGDLFGADNHYEEGTLFVIESLPFTAECTEGDSQFLPCPASAPEGPGIIEACNLGQWERRSEDCWSSDYEPL